MSRLSYQIPNFTYPDTGPDGIWDLVVAQAKEAEEAGFDRVMVMDHLYQLPGIGAHDEPMLECYATLAGLAQHTQRVRLSALVTGNTYRNPGLLAKELTTLDVLSGGRATLGIGAGWFEREHEAFGFRFESFTERFEWLEESLQIVLPLLRGETVSFDGDRYRVQDAVMSPPAVGRIPVMIGGSGERKTLRMVAEYADESNLVGLRSPEEIQPKLDALAGHCERLGRDRDEITVSLLVSVCVAETAEQAEQDIRDFVASKQMPDEAVERSKQMMVWGDADTVAAELGAFVDAGLDGLAINAIANGHVPGRVALTGEVAASVLPSTD